MWREGQLRGERGLQHVGGRELLSVVSERRAGRVVGGLRRVGPDGAVLHFPLPPQQRLDRKHGGH